jgi:type II secretory pathway pseudopilin PulG
MIVVVIVGILSGVALPSFLGQASKAKGVECTTAVGSILTSFTSDAAESKADALTNAIALASTLSTNSTNCTINTPTAASPGNILKVSAEGANDLAGEYFAEACVNIANGKKALDTSDETIEAADKPSCA